jgi:membrane protease YdiL (CAAX protease family)
MLPRIVALLEVVLCSDVITQVAVAATLSAVGVVQQDAGGGLTLRYVVAVSLVDAALLIALMCVLLRAHGERPKDLFLGWRPVLPEMRRGVLLAFAALVIAAGTLAAIRYLAPWLRTVERNPLQDLVRAPGDAVALAFVLVIAGGIREEMQRAFLLHRFEQWLGGRAVGVVVISTGFGAGHYLQGADAAVVTGVLGAFWAVVYLRRRSVVAPVASHSGFNLLQLGQLLTLGR